MTRLFKVQGALAARKKREEEEAQRKKLEEEEAQAERRWRKEVGKGLAEVEAERESERQGRTKWRAKDFGGQYHLHKIRNRFPIAGTNITVEKMRKVAAKENERKLALEKEELDSAFKTRLEHKGWLAKEAAHFRMNFDDRTYLYDKVDMAIKRRSEKVALVTARHEREREAYGTTTSKTLLLFFEAVRSGNLDTVENYLQLRVVEPNDVGEFNGGKTALIEACERGKVTMVRCLLEYGADPSQKDASGRGTLHAMWLPLETLPKDRLLEREVATQNILTTLGYLVEHDVELDMRNIDDETALHLAAEALQTPICFLILCAGSESLLQERDRWGRTPIQRIGTEHHGHECYKLLRDWVIVNQGRRLEEFRQMWSTYFEENPTRGKKGASSMKILRDFKLAEWAKESRGLFAENLLMEHMRKLELKKASKSKITQRGISGEEEDKAAKPVTEFVRKANLQYTSTYRARVEKERAKLKPSERKLTLIEYLVGTETRKRVQEQDRTTKEKQKRHKLQARRVATAQTILKDKFAGSHEDYESTLLDNEGMIDSSMKVEEMVSSAVLCRPWTASVLAQAARPVRMNALAKVSETGTKSLEKDNTFATCSRHFAKRKEEFLQENVLLDKSRSEVAIASNSTREDSTLNQSWSTLQADSTCSMGSLPFFLVPEENTDPPKRPARARETVVAGDLRGYAIHSRAVPVMQDRPQTVAGHRRAAVMQNKQTEREIYKSIDGLQRSAETQQLSQSQSQKKRFLSRRAIRDPVLMPPQPEVGSSKGVKKTFTKIEIADALSVVQKKLDKERVPSELMDAIVRSIDSDDRKTRGNVSMDELQEKFQTFVLNKEEFNTEPALTALHNYLEKQYRVRPQAVIHVANVID